MKLLSVVGVMLTAVAASPAEDAPGGPAKEIPELQPLGRFVGTWDTRMTYKSADGPGGPAEVKGTGSAEWVHGGRFLRQTWSFGAGGGLPAGSGSTMMTYDPAAKVYRSWMFFSGGSVFESEGEWNPKTRTFTWTGGVGRDPMKTTTTATFQNDGSERWSMVVKDKDGKVVNEATGTNTRRNGKE